MKTSRLLACVIALGFAAAAPAADEHPTVAGPNGGRVLAKVEPAAEFLVTPERTVRITFLDADLKPVAPGDQVVTVISGDRANPTRLAFVKDATGFVSEGPLPEGGSVPTVVQIKATPDAAAKTEKFNVNLAKCPTCAYAEYACTCGH